MRYFLIFIFLILISCSSLKEAGKVLRNEKTNTTDEFLVKKREPLVLPPDFKEIPEPGSIKKENNSEQQKLKIILDLSNEDIWKQSWTLKMIFGFLNAIFKKIQ